MQKKNPQIKVNMLGRFSLEVNGKIVLEDKGNTRKIWNLLGYLLANKDRILTPSELPDILCSDERSDDPTKAVKNLVYRLRCLLSDSALPEADYIVQTGGIYRWNPQVDVSLDVNEFIAKWREGKSEIDDQQLALKLYLEAIDLYGGRYLPRLLYEEWTTSPALKCHRGFIECITKVFEILETDNNYEPIIPICEKAISIDPYDEDIYIIYISALTKLGRQKDALVAYETITEKLYNEMGVNPSKELMIIYRGILKSIKSVETDLIAIKEDLNEPGAIDGTYCCEYEIFKDIYRFVARGVNRTGDSVFVMLCTITDDNDTIPKVEYVTKAMDKLRDVISEVLRNGDLFAQYSCAQYVIMLPNTSFENGTMVGDRIIKGFKKTSSNKFIKVHYKLQPLDPKLL